MSSHRNPSFRTLGAEREGDRLVLTAEESHHMAGVSRVQPGDRVWLLDENGLRHRAEYVRMLPDGRCEMQIRDENCEAVRFGEIGVQIDLFQALPKSKTMDEIVRGATELGARAITAVHTERSHRIRAAHVASRLERWERVAGAACKQSGRSRIPSLNGPLGFKEALTRSRDRSGVILTEDRELSGSSLKEALKRLSGTSVALFIGAEGGFSPAEMARAKESGLQRVWLGEGILRTQIAALFALSSLIYEFDDRSFGE